MEQTKALNALEPFLILSKSASSPRAAADLITQATSSPHTFIFAELLHTPNIQALRKSRDFAPYVKLLEIFAWGTMADYNSRFAWSKVHTDHADAANLPALLPQQKQKLLLLSLLPLANSTRPLTYKHLIGALSLSSVAALESLVTEAIYAQLIDGTLDPQAQVVHISSIAPLRDLSPGSLQSLLLVYHGWESHCDQALSSLDTEIKSIRLRARNKKGREARLRAMLEERLGEKPEESTGTKGGGKRGADGDGEQNKDGMDIDDVPGKTYPSKRTLIGR
jgi:COP9 signalosome complex subunit 7